MAEYTNIFENGEVTGYNPDADGDYYKVTDGQLDHNYWQEKIAQALKVISTTPNDDYIIIYGGEVTDSGSGQVDIAEGAALGKDASGNIGLIIQQALTNVDLPSGWNDDRQIWVVGKYANKLGTSTRNHAATAESYHYTAEDSYVGESDNDDLFVDADPTATSVCWGSFKMNGTTFAEQAGERSNVYNFEADTVVGGTGISLAWKVIEIGDWNMDSTATKNVTHGITDYKKIRQILVTIRDDSDNSYEYLGNSYDHSVTATMGLNRIRISDIHGTQYISMDRVPNGLFDSASYDSTSYNRGWITIGYEV